ncbi:MAG TPA: hypothetical protein VFN57_02765 [Thermomicrobiaceae bacterium]|nr:hypothetical protein [Thermomicrobiaceae bacterium]
MDERARADILAEILRERLPGVERVVEEWSVPEAEAVSYAQLKDLIWQLAAPLGLSMLGFSAAEHARQAGEIDVDLQAGQALFARVGQDTGRLLERFVRAAADLQP